MDSVLMFTRMEKETAGLNLPAARARTRCLGAGLCSSLLLVVSGGWLWRFERPQAMIGERLRCGSQPRRHGELAASHNLLEGSGIQHTRWA